MEYEILKFNEGMKFDVILSNAPYDNGLHEKFEAKYFNLCDGQIVWVSPLSFLLGKKQNKKITLELDKYATDIEQINGNEYFDAAIGGTMGIVYVDMSDKYLHYVKFDGKEYDKCSEISKYSNDPYLSIFKSCIDQLSKKDSLYDNLTYSPGILSHSPGIKTHTEYNPDDNWYCIRMVKPSHDYCILPTSSEIPVKYKDIGHKKIDVQKKDGSIIKKPYMEFYYHFDTKRETENCIKYFKTMFVRMSLMLYMTQSLNFLDTTTQYIPWFDFSDSIFEGTPEEIDMALFKKYNISQDIINHILEILPNYYDLDLTKYKGQD